MDIKQVIYKDLPKIKYLRPGGWSDIVPDFEFYLKSNYCRPIKVVENDKIIGLGASITFDTTGWIAHIIVHKNQRHRGIGNKIVQNLMENLEKHSIHSCSLIASEMGKPLYLKAGFREVTEYVFMKNEGSRYHKSINQNIVPFRKEYLTMVYQLDKKISGESREKLLNQHLTEVQIYLEGNKVLGCYLPNLKEGHIIADTEEAGIALMEMKYSKAKKAVLPSDNKAGIKFLQKNGFVKSISRGTRMIYGKDIPVQLEKIYARIGGNLG